MQMAGVVCMEWDRKKVDGSSCERLFTGSYSGCLRTWDSSKSFEGSRCLKKIDAHQGRVLYKVKTPIIHTF